MQGPGEAEVIRQAERNRVPLPKAIQEAPVLDFWLVWYYQAFLDLHTCRNVGMDEGAIPWTAMNEYAKRYSVDDDDEFDFFCRLIRAMDSAYTKWKAEQREKKKTAIGSTPKPIAPKQPAAKRRG